MAGEVLLSATRLLWTVPSPQVSENPNAPNREITAMKRLTKFSSSILSKIVFALCVAMVCAPGFGPAVGGILPQSIGGPQHDPTILGVKIGMDIPTALQTIFENSGRKPGQEKPDAKRTEGKDNKDIRVLYKGLHDGEVQIVFGANQRVKEILLVYAGPIPVESLRLPSSSGIGEAMGGQRFDDRYTIGFTSTNKLEQFWWRDEMGSGGYRIRVGFISGKRGGTQGVTTVMRKIVSVTPGDEEKFLKAAS